MGKYSMNKGVRMVPNPKPEKKVRMATKKAAMLMIKISIKAENKTATNLAGGGCVVFYPIC